MHLAHLACPLFVLVVVFFYTFDLAVTRNVNEPRLHHIPKTGGTSARLKLNSLGEWNIEHTECCFKSIPPQRAVVSFIRRPRDQVYSQYLECRYDIWGKSVTKNTAFPRSSSDENDFAIWLQHFEKSKYNFNCYHPYNMQTRSFLPTCLDSHSYVAMDKSLAAAAIDNMLSMTAVGITHHFKLSICVIMYILTHQFPTECNCRQEFKTVHETHGVPVHSTESLNASIMQYVHKNSHYDDMLYQAALIKFWNQVHTIEAITQSSLRCLYT